MRNARNTFCVLTIAILAVAVAACDNTSTAVVKQSTDPETVPTMTTHDVQTLISDSGRTRYRITTKLWHVFSEAKVPHWTFPNGVVADELDEKYHHVASLICDSAYYNMQSHVWSAIGNVQLTTRNGDKVKCDRMYYDEHQHQVNCQNNVRITRMRGDKILTNQLYYDTQKGFYHSASFIHYEGNGRVVEGYGYQFYERDKHAKIDQVQGIFPINDRSLSHP